MTANELRRTYLEALKTFNDYRWDIAKKHGIVRFSVIEGIEHFSNDEWERVASDEEQKQATVFDNEMMEAWLAYREALREEKGLSGNDEKRRE